MQKVWLAILLRVLLVVAVAASAALVVDYQNAGDPAFCGVGTGCFQVRMSEFSRVFGVPLPRIGLGAFAGLFIASLFVRTKAHLRMLASATIAGGLMAVGLLVVQGAVVGAFCAWCRAHQRDRSVVPAPWAARDLGGHEEEGAGRRFQKRWARVAAERRVRGGVGARLPAGCPRL